MFYSYIEGKVEYIKEGIQNIAQYNTKSIRINVILIHTISKIKNFHQFVRTVAHGLVPVSHKLYQL